MSTLLTNTDQHHILEPFQSQAAHLIAENHLVKNNKSHLELPKQKQTPMQLELLKVTLGC